ncbi:hypothetical protein [Psychrobacillus vulpis]|uniref:Stage III sporulation protein AD n=1 Tax=Psychrobacillus vulpis TaxID=2325572 RepID=A0A544TQ40_9BACI|nr:hypothetical protein [Psychrobacillus vulpis]TQR19571.1 hypothetical protein FG384_11615 [Psychrobacillus vulpis]
MIVYVTIIIAFCLLQLVKEIYPRIHSVIYTIYIILFLYYILMTFIIPYTTEFISVIPSALLPVFKLLIFSVILLFVSQIIEELLADYEYTSLATIITFTTKAILVLVWLRHMQQFYEKFFSIMGLLS